MTTITVDQAGYAMHARCGKGHSGNQRLAPVDAQRKYWACQGCGAYYTAESVAAPADAENGSGGVILRTSGK